MEYKRKNELIEYLIQEVDAIPIEKIVGSVVELTGGRYGGRYLDGLCPFHPDSHIGNFKVTPSMNIWRCFACDVGGRGIKFEMEYYNLSFLDALFKLALDYAIITKEEYDAHTRRKYDPKMVKRLQKAQDEPKKMLAPRKASEKVIHNVYSAIPHVCTLSKAHRDHLKQERRLSDADMADYFTFPTRRADLAHKVYLCLSSRAAENKFGKKPVELTEQEKKDIDKMLSPVCEEIRYVPGFFYDKSENRIDFSSYRGIGFLVRDNKGKVKGIQIRRDQVRKGDSRYVWFSSSFAYDHPSLDGGASPGSPGGVIYTKRETPRTPSICITEGRFKAEKIAELGNIAVYVSGVSAWRSVLPMVQSIRKDKETGNTVYLMFDADMMGNVAVHRQLKAFAEALMQAGFTPHLILWPKTKGKGFDDLVNGNPRSFKKYLKVIRYDRFESIYADILADLLRGKTIRDISADEADAFTETLQMNVEKKVLQLIPQQNKDARG